MVMPWKKKIMQSHSWVTNDGGVWVEVCLCVWDREKEDWEKERKKEGERDKEVWLIAWVLLCVQRHPLWFWSAPSWKWILHASWSSQAYLPFVAPMREWREDERDIQRHRETVNDTEKGTDRQQECLCMCNEIHFVVHVLRFTIDGRIFKMDMITKMSPYGSDF